MGDIDGDPGPHVNDIIHKQRTVSSGKIIDQFFLYLIEWRLPTVTTQFYGAKNIVILLYRQNENAGHRLLYLIDIMRIHFRSQFQERISTLFDVFGPDIFHPNALTGSHYQTRESFGGVEQMHINTHRPGCSIFDNADLFYPTASRHQIDLPDVRIHALQQHAQRLVQD